MALENEASLRSPAEVRAGLLEIWQAMRECIGRGLGATGVLPGGLMVERRAAALYRVPARAARSPAPSTPSIG